MSLNSEVNEGMSIAQIMRGMLQRRLLIIIPTFLGLAAGAAFLSVNKPRFIAEAQVIIENQFTPFDKTVGPQDSSTGLQVSNQIVSSQLAAMKSEDIAARVVDQLHLDANPEYNANLRSSGAIGKLLVTLGFKDDPALYSAKALAAKTLASDLTIYSIPESNVIGVKSTSGEAAIAAAAANAVAETYVLTTREVGASGTDRARDWLAKQIEGLRAKVAESDQAVERYRAEAGLIRGASSTLGTQQISELNTQIGLAQSARIEAETKANSIQRLLKAKGDVNSSAEALASPSLQRLKDEQVAAARDITQVSATYLPSHPKYVAAQRHLDAVNNQIKVEAQRVVDSLQNQAQSAEERAASLNNELQKLKNNQALANFSDVRLQALQRDAAANRTLLQSMLSRYADANARQDTSMQPGFARIIQKAVAPAAPYFPKSGPTLTLAAIAGLLMGLGLAFVMEILSQGPAVATSPRRREALEEDKIPTETILPRLDMPERVAKANSATVVAKSPELMMPVAAVKAKPLVPEVLCSVIGATDAASSKALLVSSSKEITEQSAKVARCVETLAQSEGKQTFAFTSIGSRAPNAGLLSICIGRSLAAKGKRVMLVDLAPRGDSVEALLDIVAGPGLSDLVAGKADFTKSVCRDTQSKMHFVRFGVIANDAQEQTVVSRLPAITTALRMVYDIVIFNMGEARPAIVEVLATADRSFLMATPQRLNEAAAAAKALEEAGNTKALLIGVDIGSSSTKTKASA